MGHKTITAGKVVGAEGPAVTTWTKNPQSDVMTFYRREIRIKLRGEGVLPLDALLRPPTNGR